MNYNLKKLKEEWEKKGVNLYEQIEVIAKKEDKVMKIVGITRIEWLELKRVPGWNYQAYQLGVSCYSNAKEINYKTMKK